MGSLCRNMLLIFLVGLVAGQETTIDPLNLIALLGTPPSMSDASGRNLGDITVRPTDSPIVSVDKYGASCKCVSYYLCDENHIAVDANNAPFTGWGELDIRFGEDDQPPRRTCQESMEVCCIAPLDPPKEKLTPFRK